MILVTAQHLHAARRKHGGYCTRGVDGWFTKHGLNLREFLRNGYPIDVIEGTGDLMGKQVAQIAREQTQ